jgi:hypothetical protein
LCFGGAWFKSNSKTPAILNRIFIVQSYWAVAGVVPEMRLLLFSSTLFHIHCSLIILWSFTV